MLESVKERLYVSKCNPADEFSLESLIMIFSPVHQSSPVIVDYLNDKRCDCEGAIDPVMLRATNNF